MIVGVLVHEAGTVIQAPKPVCQFMMAEDIPPPVLNQLVIRYLVNLLVRIKEPSSPTGWQQSPQPQTEDTKKSRKLDCVATGFIYNDAVNFTVDVRLSVCLWRFLTLGLFGRRVIVVACVCPSVRLSVCLFPSSLLTQ